MVVHSPLFVRIITGDFARAIALYPFVFIKHKRDLQNQILLNHEKIHLQQQRELLILPFYLWYLLDYALGRLKGKNHHDAYRQIIFEQEAFGNEKDEGYLQKRTWWAFRKHL